jgi:hydrogenase maturation protease
MAMSTQPRVLVYGYGNPARQDDGLGPRCVEAVRAWDMDGVETDANYQPQIEDAVDVASHAVVVFVDAATAGPAPFAFAPLAPCEGAGFTTHRVEPGELLAMAESLFGAAPSAFLLGIRGYDFAGFAEGLSGPAEDNLRAALVFLKPFLQAAAAAR